MPVLAVTRAPDVSRGIAVGGLVMYRGEGHAFSELEDETMGWTSVAASIGTSTAIAGLKAARKQMTKRQYKRLLATAVAQILELHPDIGRKKARRRARRLTGGRPSKKLMRPTTAADWKAGAEGAMVAAATAGVAKVVSAVGGRLKARSEGGDAEAGEHQRVEQADDAMYGHAGVRH